MKKRACLHVAPAREEPRAAGRRHRAAWPLVSTCQAAPPTTLQGRGRGPPAAAAPAGPHRTRVSHAPGTAELNPTGRALACAHVFGQQENPIKASMKLGPPRTASSGSPLWREMVSPRSFPGEAEQHTPATRQNHQTYIFNSHRHFSVMACLRTVEVKECRFGTFFRFHDANNSP